MLLPRILSARSRDRAAATILAVRSEQTRKLDKLLKKKKLSDIRKQGRAMLSERKETNEVDPSSAFPQGRPGRT